MARFHIPIEQREEIIPRLGKQELHWKKGRSAYELSTAWMAAKGVPPIVAAVLDQAPEWKGAELLDAIFERETELGSRGRPSQTDLLAVMALHDGNAVIGVEGKVDEPFGPRVGEWLAEAKDGNRLGRLTGLCATLGVDPAQQDRFFYQLFHRTCAAIYEAQRFKYPRALMLVHSFSVTAAWFEEFAAFATAVGMPVQRPGTVSPSRKCAGIEMQLAWVSDKPAA